MNPTLLLKNLDGASSLLTPQTGKSTKSKNGGNETNAAGAAAGGVAGSLIGNALFPGVGGFIGEALGSAIGGEI
jgi:uncharacterized membrane protein